MKHRFLFVFLTFLMLGNTYAYAQQLNMRVVAFDYDPTDLTRVDRVDKGSGSPYALIKLSSDRPDDDLRAYRFDFGMLDSETDVHDGELWVYVQQGAKRMSISRSGYNTIRNHDLGYTLESGKVYHLKLSAQGPVVYTQMTMFEVKPADSKAAVMITNEATGQRELLGYTDETGGVAKSLEFGTYTYEVMSENYYPSEGRFTLNNQSETHRETVVLRPNGATVTLTVAADADIYVNNTKRGTRSWSGLLKAGNYQVECRQTNHRPSVQTISVTEGNSQTFTLTPPTPITGTLAVTSRPLGASIKIDGRDYGTTPRNITDLVIGQHSITLSREGYNDETQTIEVKENEVAEANVTLSNVPVKPEELTFTITGNGKTVSFTMKLVEAGTFQMENEEIGKGADEDPFHKVTLTKDYYMGETEVTQALWYAVMGKSPTSNGSKWSSRYGIGDNYPAYYISYDDITSFLSKLNSLASSQLPSGMSFRFPTEAEWAFAAKGGNNSKGYTYAGSNTIDDVAWYTDNSDSSTHPVKSKSPNELGLYDMSGNVWEWCYDWYVEYNSSAQTDPTGPTMGDARVLRGGSWYDNATDCRTATRNANRPSSDFEGNGFRLAL